MCGEYEIKLKFDQEITLGQMDRLLDKLSTALACDVGEGIEYDSDGYIYIEEVDPSDGPEIMKAVLNCKLLPVSIMINGHCIHLDGECIDWLSKYICMLMKDELDETQKN